MFKLVTFAGYDNRTGPHIFPIRADVDESIGHIKMARPLPPQIEQYIRTAEGTPGKTTLLIDAMGAGEFYGSNVNGDYFSRAALEHKGRDYGHETFMHYAYPFRHHVNKDPARAYGDKVILASYDPHMHRVLLIVRIDDKKCRDILDDMEQGNYADVSMGAKVPFDRCSICGNKAKSRGQYCPHLRYQMNKILQDGRRVFAHNDYPKFFDISFVTIGAEKASHVLKKVAGVAVPEIISSAKAAEIHYGKLAQDKKADIEKDVPSQPAANIQGATTADKAKMNTFMAQAGQVKAQEPELPPQVLDQLGGFPLRKILGTIAAMGIDLRPQEFQRIILVKQGAAALADQLESRRLVFDESNPGPMPAWGNEIANLGSDDVSEKVAMVIAPFLQDRSCYPEILLSRLQRMTKSAEVSGYNRDNQWYPLNKEESRKSSGVRGVMPASMALAAGFLVFRRAFPGLVTKGPSPVKAIAKHPWLLPLLMGAGIGASVGFAKKTEPMPIGPHGTGSGVDAKNKRVYHQTKTAGVNPFVSMGLIPLSYIYAGVQQKTASQSNDFEHFASIRPDAIGSTKAIDKMIFQSITRLAKD